MERPPPTWQGPLRAHADSESIPYTWDTTPEAHQVRGRPTGGSHPSGAPEPPVGPFPETRSAARRRSQAAWKASAASCVADQADMSQEEDHVPEREAAAA